MDNKNDTRIEACIKNNIIIKKIAFKGDVCLKKKKKKNQEMNR
jgi:hypothetical protein